MNVHQQQIYDHLLGDIVAGKLSRNKRIPTENELGNLFNTNRMNAHLAIKELERFGILRRNKRQGTFVHRPPDARIMGELKSRGTRRVCILSHSCPQAIKIHWNERVNDVLEEEMRKNDINIDFKDISTLNSREEFSEFIKKIVEDGYNSLIMIGDDFINNIVSSHPEILFKFHNNIFIFDHGSTRWSDWPYNVVSVNLFGEGVIAAEYLFRKNYRRIIFVSFDYTCFWQQERERGLQYGLLRDSGGEIKAEHFEVSAGHEGKALDLLKNSDEKCAIVAATDAAAASIFQSATERNLKPGEDFGLIGFDDNAVFRKLELTTISPPLEEIGAKLVELVIKKLDNKKNREVNAVRIDSDLIIRKTC